MREACFSEAESLADLVEGIIESMANGNKLQFHRLFPVGGRGIWVAGVHAAGGGPERQGPLQPAQVTPWGSAVL